MPDWLNRLSIGSVLIQEAHCSWYHRHLLAGRRCWPGHVGIARLRDQQSTTGNRLHCDGWGTPRATQSQSWFKRTLWPVPDDSGSISGRAYLPEHAARSIDHRRRTEWSNPARHRNAVIPAVGMSSTIRTLRVFEARIPSLVPPALRPKRSLRTGCCCCPPSRRPLSFRGPAHQPSRRVVPGDGRCCPAAWSPCPAGSPPPPRSPPPLFAAMLMPPIELPRPRDGEVPCHRSRLTPLLSDPRLIRAAGRQQGRPRTPFASPPAPLGVGLVMVTLPSSFFDGQGQVAVLSVPSASVSKPEAAHPPSSAP